MDLQFFNETSEGVWATNWEGTVFYFPFSKLSNKQSNELPDVLKKASSASWPCIVAYAVVFFVTAVGNIIEFGSVWQRLRKRSSAMSKLLLHLCIADILVVFMVAAVQVYCRISVGCYLGNIMCTHLKFLDCFSTCKLFTQ